MSAVRGILYDLDGVLIDSAHAWHRVIERGLALAGRPPLGWQRFRASFGQGVDADRAELFPEWSAAELAAFYERAFAEELDAVELVPGAAETLTLLHQRGLAQAVVTNTPLALARRILALTGLDRHLDALAAAGEAAEKPAPDLLRLALARLGLERDDALYVGDSPVDAAAARAAGVRLLLVGEITIADLPALVVPPPAP